MGVYIKNSGVWRKAQALYYKDSSTQRAVRRVYRKHQGVWRQVFGSTGTIRYATAGSYNFAVPEGVYSLGISYPTMASLVNTTLAVTPGQVIPVTIGSYGAQSVFGSIQSGIYTQNVISWSGNIDHTITVYFGCGSATGADSSRSGNRTTLNTGFNSVGIYYNEGGEVYHGDLSASVNINTLPSSTLVGSTEIYFAATGGRGTKTITQHPSSSNGYVGAFYLYDPYSNESFYSATVAVRQIVPFTITW